MKTPHLPHAPLPDYYRDEADHARYVRRIFDETAVDYDRIERAMAFGSGGWYRREALKRAGLASGDKVVDVGIGTGLLAREACALIGAQGRLIGVDPSPGMLAQVDLPGVELRAGRAEEVPCATGEADFLSFGYAFRHVSDVDAALQEFLRVLRPGGRLLILEISQPERRLSRMLLKFYMRRIVPTLARVVSRERNSAELWRYYWDTIETCIPPAQILQAMERAGFLMVKRHTELGVFSEYTAVRP
ncbi:class I SAM-dependent methyltransferase [Hydrogenophaga sp.]|jgi:demethylmenaquinone methyltransferase/2-methoxy-6-polyprenyl-1,4-benzoquinol methylase|uniref:class I SAM-dependent methyltransferase n=1 Tax=Hydrogenophaga sp. TaxID=1904254 RepID=UPI00272F4347|nr:class I SAM-dependent methyltransferase [Hydrogenophaga sp.]MDP1686630.1 class I SAM-dependent methyltransferase [Hydrogenophaga sp.]